MTPKFNVFKRAATRHRDALACHIAARCATAVMRQMRPDTAPMGAAELRGYVRARARSVVRTEVEPAVAHGRVSATEADDLIAAALERTVHLVIREIQTPPVVDIPAPHVPLRSAA
jgi:hypothetical protein